MRQAKRLHRFKTLGLLEGVKQSAFISAHQYNYFERFRRLVWLDGPKYPKIEVGRGSQLYVDVRALRNWVPPRIQNPGPRKMRARFPTPRNLAVIRFSTYRRSPV